MPKLKISDRAERDLVEIGRYIARDNPANAARFIYKLKKNFQLLTAQPMIGKARGEFSSGMRSIVYGHYLIFYRVTGKDIEIAHVLHGARDIERLMKDRENS